MWVADRPELSVNAQRALQADARQAFAARRYQPFIWPIAGEPVAEIVGCFAWQSFMRDQDVFLRMVLVKMCREVVDASHGVVGPA